MLVLLCMAVFNASVVELKESTPSMEGPVALMLVVIGGATFNIILNIMAARGKR